MKSLRWLVCFGLCLGVLSLTTGAIAQNVGGGSGVKDNLDLPFDAVGENESEEDAPEVVIFYGQQLEGDGFFYTIDRSGSMQDSGELGRAKQEISRNVSELSNRTQFGIVFFDKGIQKFPASGRPVEATPGMKSAALGWVAGMRGGGGSCCQAGFLQALRYANMSKSRRKVVVYVGDGGGTCSASGVNESTYLQRTEQAITQQNYQRATIHCVGVLMTPNRQTNRDFMKRVAAQAGGNYKEI